MLSLKALQRTLIQATRPMSKTSSPTSTPKRSQGRPRGSHADVAILKGAANAFAEKGFHLCRVEDILESAQVSRTNFYRFFKSKEQVFEQLITRELDYAKRAITQLKQQFTDADPPEERLRRIVEKDVEVAMEAGPFLKVLLMDTPNLSDYGPWLEESDSYFSALIADTIESMGQPRPEPLLVKSIMVAARTILVELSTSDQSIQQKQQQATRLIMRLMSALITHKHRCDLDSISGNAEL